MSAHDEQQARLRDTIDSELVVLGTSKSVADRVVSVINVQTAINALLALRASPETGTTEEKDFSAGLIGVTDTGHGDTLLRPNKREQLAALAHKQWAGWMRYMFTRGDHRSNGDWLVPWEWVQRWQRQMNTPYEHLSSGEQESDRKEADRVLALVEDLVITARASVRIIEERHYGRMPAEVEKAICALKAVLVGYHGNQSLSEASGSAQSEAQKEEPSTGSDLSVEVPHA